MKHVRVTGLQAGKAKSLLSLGVAITTDTSLSQNVLHIALQSHLHIDNWLSGCYGLWSGYYGLWSVQHATAPAS